MMRYLPFIIISLVLYTLFFYHNQEPDILSPDSVNIDEKIVPLDFKKLEQQIDPIKGDPAQPISPQKQYAFNESGALPSAAEATPITVPKEMLTIDNIPTPIAIQAPNSIPPKVNNHFKASIKEVAAIDAALLKGELYEQDFYLHLPPPPANAKPLIKSKVAKAKPKKTNSQNTTPKATAKTTATKAEPSTDSLSSKLLKQQKTDVKKAPVETTASTKTDKPKRSFKKQVKAIAPVNLEQPLQEAIAVSGNKPHYPEQAKTAKQQGQIAVKFTVNMQGKTKNPSVINSTGHKELDDAVLEFIAKERFMPALKGIEKVTSEQLYTFKYELK